MSAQGAGAIASQVGGAKFGGVGEEGKGGLLAAMEAEHVCALTPAESIFMELVTSHRKLKASSEGSK